MLQQDRHSYRTGNPDLLGRDITRNYRENIKSTMRPQTQQPGASRGKPSFRAYPGARHAAAADRGLCVSLGEPELSLGEPELSFLRFPGGEETWARRDGPLSRESAHGGGGGGGGGSGRGAAEAGGAGLEAGGPSEGRAFPA